MDDGVIVAFARRARSALLPGDVLLAVDGAGPDPSAMGEAWSGERDSVATLLVERDGRRFTERAQRIRCE